MAIFSSDLAHSTRRRWTLYAGTLVFLGLFGSWLALDFLHERARTLDEMGRLALHKSQLLSSVLAMLFCRQIMSCAILPAGLIPRRI